MRDFAERLAEVLEPVKRWKSEPENGPSFVRLHSADGKILALTFIIMAARNRFFFETFPKSSECVVICRPGDNGELEGWASLVPGGVRRAVSRRPEADAGEPCPALRRLWEDV